MMPTQPVKISLIAPIYGVESYIEKFADSVLSQSYPHIEFIFVNDGTKDHSMEVLESVINERYLHRKHQITIVNKENEGLPAARMTGIEYATGDYIYHVDSDDWLSDGAIAKLAAKIEETGADIVYFNLVKEYPGHISVKREREYNAGGEVVCRDVHQRFMYIRNIFTHRSFGFICNKCARRSLYTENDIMTPRYGYCEDACLYMQLIGYADSIAYLDEVLYHYRKGNPSAMTAQRRRKRKMMYALNFLDLWEHYHGISPEINPVVLLCDDIVIKVGWYSLVYRLDLFRERPYLASAILKASMSRNSNVWFVGQLVTKLYAWLYLKFRFFRK